MKNTFTYATEEEKEKLFTQSENFFKRNFGELIAAFAKARQTENFINECSREYTVKVAKEVWSFLTTSIDSLEQARQYAVDVAKFDKECQKAFAEKHPVLAFFNGNIDNIEPSPIFKPELLPTTPLDCLLLGADIVLTFSHVGKLVGIGIKGVESGAGKLSIASNVKSAKSVGAAEVLAKRLTLQQAGVLDLAGNITSDVVKGAMHLKPGIAHHNPLVLAEFAKRGGADKWGKYTSKSFSVEWGRYLYETPKGEAITGFNCESKIQVHFYKSTSGEVLTGIDYKVTGSTKLNRGVTDPAKLSKGIIDFELTGAVAKKEIDYHLTFSEKNRKILQELGKTREVTSQSDSLAVIAAGSFLLAEDDEVVAAESPTDTNKNKAETEAIPIGESEPETAKDIEADSVEAEREDVADADQNKEKPQTTSTYEFQPIQINLPKGKLAEIGEFLEKHFMFIPTKGKGFSVGVNFSGEGAKGFISGDVVMLVYNLVTDPSRTIKGLKTSAKDLYKLVTFHETSSDKFNKKIADVQKSEAEYQKKKLGVAKKIEIYCDIPPEDKDKSLEACGQILTEVEKLIYLNAEDTNGIDGGRYEQHREIKSRADKSNLDKKEKKQLKKDCNKIRNEEIPKERKTLQTIKAGFQEEAKRLAQEKQCEAGLNTIGDKVNEIAQKEQAVWTVLKELPEDYQTETLQQVITALPDKISLLMEEIADAQQYLDEFKDSDMNLLPEDIVTAAISQREDLLHTFKEDAGLLQAFFECLQDGVTAKEIPNKLLPPDCSDKNSFGKYSFCSEYLNNWCIAQFSTEYDRSKDKLRLDVMTFDSASKQTLGGLSEEASQGVIGYLNLIDVYEQQKLLAAEQKEQTEQQKLAQEEPDKQQDYQDKIDELQKEQEDCQQKIEDLKNRCQKALAIKQQLTLQEQLFDAEKQTFACSLSALIFDLFGDLLPYLPKSVSGKDFSVWLAKYRTTIVNSINIVEKWFKILIVKSKQDCDLDSLVTSVLGGDDSQHKNLIVDLAEKINFTGEVDFWCAIAQFIKTIIICLENLPKNFAANLPLVGGILTRLKSAVSFLDTPAQYTIEISKILLDTFLYIAGVYKNYANIIKWFTSIPTKFIRYVVTLVFAYIMGENKEAKELKGHILTTSYWALFIKNLLANLGASGFGVLGKYLFKYIDTITRLISLVMRGLQFQDGLIISVIGGVKTVASGLETLSPYYLFEKIVTQTTVDTIQRHYHNAVALANRANRSKRDTIEAEYCFNECMRLVRFSGMPRNKHMFQEFYVSSIFYKYGFLSPGIFEQISPGANDLFQAIAVYVGSSYNADNLRASAANYIERKAEYFKNFIDGDIFEHIKKLRDGNLLGSELEVRALERILNRPIIIAIRSAGGSWDGLYFKGKNDFAKRPYTLPVGEPIFIHLDKTKGCYSVLMIKEGYFLAERYKEKTVRFLERRAQRQQAVATSSQQEAAQKHSNTVIDAGFLNRYQEALLRRQQRKQELSASVSSTEEKTEVEETVEVHDQSETDRATNWRCNIF